MATTVHADRTRQDLRHMFGRWGIEQFTLLRDQEEYVSGVIKRGDGVTVSYFRKGNWQSTYCNRNDYAKNLRAIYLFLDRVRIAEKVGIAYQGLSSTKDLVARGAPTNGSRSDAETLEDAYDVLGVDKSDPDDLIERIYAQKARSYHPDAGGDPEKFKRITRAKETIMKARGK